MIRDSGIVTVWRGRNTAPAGAKPVVAYDQKIIADYYGEKTVGIQRFYTAKAQNARADLLIEIDRCGSILPDDRCQLEPASNGTDAGWYKIIQVQHLTDEDSLPVTDLTLERIDSIDRP